MAGHSAGEVVAMCQELMRYVSAILNPQCSQQERSKYEQTIDTFKTSHALCMPCGFQLAQDQNPVARHFGLQLIEVYVKHRWNHLGESERNSYLQELLQFMTQGVQPSEEAFVKEAIAKVTVETVKRTWPQLWKNFLPDMSNICANGPVQVELVLIILRRLAEDVHLFDSGIDQKRKKEMSAALNENIVDIFNFILQYLEAPSAPDIETESHLRLVALSSMSSFVEWMEFEVILLHNCKLLNLLYTFLSEETLKTPACECLLHILARKGDVKRTAEQREKLLILLSKEAMEGFWKASVKASQMITAVVDEVQYVFLKRMCQVLVHLGTSQLGALWLHSKEKFKPPADFKLYLEMILTFTMHDSQLLSMTSSDVWSCFINHNHIKDDETFKAFMPRILPVCRCKFIKLGNPTLSTHITSEFSRIDFDGEEEYVAFYASYRSKIFRIVAQLCQLMPRHSAQEAVQEVEKLVLNTPGSDYSRESVEFMEWDAFASYLECWTGTFKSDPALMEIPEVKEKALIVLRQLVSFSTESALLLQCQFRCLQSGLILFLHHDNQLFDDFIQRVFASVGYMGNGTNKYDLSKDVVTTRNLVVTCFTNLCERHSKVLAVHLNSLSTYYSELLQQDKLVYAEKCSFTEALLMLSLEVHSLEDQSKFVKFLLSEVTELFLELKNCVSSVESFISYFGLDKDLPEESYKRQRRFGLCHVVHCLSHVLSRSRSVSEIPSLTGPEQHPTFNHVLPIVAHLCIPLLGILYQLWSGKYKLSLSEHFKDLDQFHPFERDNVLGKTMQRRSEEVSKTEVRNLQMNLAAVHEGCLQNIAKIVSVYGARSMCTMGLVQAARYAIFPAAKMLNHWRLRVLLRHLINPLVASCPDDCWGDVLYPFLSETCDIVFQRLKKSWDTIEQRLAMQQPNGLASDSKTESEEVFEEQLTISLSREYSDLLELVCVKRIEGGRKLQKGDVEMSEDAVAEASEATDEQWSLYCTLSALGAKLLSSPMKELLFLSSFYGLAWKDTHTANKCTSVAGLIYENVIKGDLSSALEPSLFQQVLSALHIHGIHDHVRSLLSFLALLIYKSAFERHPLAEILVQQYQVEESKLKAFNQLLKKNPPATIKTKKEKFRDIIKNIIGRHVSEAYKHKLTFDLPEVQFKKKMLTENLDTPDLSDLFDTGGSNA